MPLLDSFRPWKWLIVEALFDKPQFGTELQNARNGASPMPSSCSRHASWIAPSAGKSNSPRVFNASPELWYL